MNNLTPNYKTLTRIPLFRRAVLQSFPFIEEDFDALTDYELLCKVVEYLNNVIEQQNLVGENTDELLRVYLELKEYVENYFDNLDVQEEINNKLDEMATDGSLTNLIKAYVDPIYQVYEQSINNVVTTQNGRISAVENKLTIIASGSPLVASSTSDMTDTTRVYVNTTDGKWYYFDGDSWEIGGTYQSTEIADGSVTPIKTNFMEQINMIPTNNWINDKLLNYSTGEEMNYTDASYCSDYIEIPEDETKLVLLTNNTSNVGVHIYYYDNTYDFISSSSENNNPIVTFVNNSKYIRIGFTYLHGPSDYIMLFYKDFKKGLNIYNEGKLKDDYINFDSDKILYNVKKLNILPMFFNPTLTTPYIKGNKVYYSFTNEVEANDYIGIFANWNVKLGDILKVKFTGTYPNNSTLLLFKSRTDYFGVAYPGIGEVSITDGIASITVDETILNALTENTLVISFKIPLSEYGTVYSFNVELSLNDDYYYFSDFIRDNYSPMTGYKAIYLGDSITKLSRDRGWITYFNSIINVTDYVNVAQDGARLRDFNDTVYDGNPTYGNNNNVLGNQVQKIINNFETYLTPDFIIIAIGTNDGISASVNDGYNAYYNNQNELIPLSNVDRTTDAGAFRYANEKLHELYPNAMIVWCTPIQAFNGIRNLKSILSYGDSLKNLCSIGSVYCIDTEKCGINGVNEIRGNNGEYLADGLHPNVKGAKMIGTFNACEFKKFLDKIDLMKI